jgi:GR25 family glycosyltransferase involved in LPS biosynthesis
MHTNYTEGLNNFDIIYIINLEHRKDRLNQVTNELSKTNIDPNKVKRIDAIYCPHFGGLGCSKSHVLALEEFISSGKDTCIIFEDDFVFTEPQNVVNDLINEVFNNAINFDVLMLSSNTVVEETTNYPFITKIIDAQTLSGYAVSKKFAHILLDNYKESIKLVEPFGYEYPEYCVDMYMKRLQPVSEWYCIKPKIGKQGASYSDIVKIDVDYGC